MIFDDHEIHAEWKISERWQAQVRGARLVRPRGSRTGWRRTGSTSTSGNLSPRDAGRERDLRARARRATTPATLLRARDGATPTSQPGHSRWSLLARPRPHAARRDRLARRPRPRARPPRDDRRGRVALDRGAGRRRLRPPAAGELGAVPAEPRSARPRGEDRRARRRHARPARRRVRRAVPHGRRASITGRRSSVSLPPLVDSCWPTSPPASAGDAPELDRDARRATSTTATWSRPASPRGRERRARSSRPSRSAYRKDLAPSEMKAMRLGNSRTGALIGRALGRAATGASGSPIGWRTVEEPRYDNQVSTLELGAGSARLRVESTTGADWRAPGADPAVRADAGRLCARRRRSAAGDGRLGPRQPRQVAPRRYAELAVDVARVGAHGLDRRSTARARSPRSCSPAGAARGRRPRGRSAGRARACRGGRPGRRRRPSAASRACRVRPGAAR